MGLHIIVHNVQSMQLLQSLCHNSVLVSNICLINRLCWHAWRKQNTSSARTGLHWLLCQVKHVFLKQRRLDCCICSMLVSHGGGCGAYLEEVPDHAFDLGLLGRSVGDALLCAWPAAHPCTVPCFCKPTFQVPSLGKPAANVEANLSKQYALLELLCSHKEQCKHACICSWRGFGAIVNNVSMHTCSFGNLTSPKST